MNLILTHILAQVQFNNNMIHYHTQFIITLFRLYAASYISKKLQNVKKNIKHGKLNKFLLSLNAVFRTPREMFTHHYVCVDDLPCDSFE